VIQITDHTANHTRKDRAPTTHQEAGNNHTGNVWCQSAGDLHRFEEDASGNKDGITALDLGKGCEDHRGNGETEAEGREPSETCEFRDAKLGRHGGQRRRVGAGIVSCEHGGDTGEPDGESLASGRPEEGITELGEVGSWRWRCVDIERRR